MPPRSRKPKSIYQQAAATLLVMMIYQLGACPCGCVEHNAWIDLLGLSSVHHDDDSAIVMGHYRDSAWSGTDEHSHDCAGKSPAQYFDNNRKSSMREGSVTFDPFHTALITLAATQAINTTPCARQLGLAAARTAARHRSALQVYRL